MRVRGPSVPLEPSALKNVLLRVGVAPQSTYACATEVAVTVALRMVSSLKVLS